MDVYHPYCHSISVAHHQLSLCLGAASVAYISNDVPLWLEYRTNAYLPLLSEEGRVKSEKLNRDKGLSFRSVFAIRREEWPVAAIVTVLLLVIHYFFISRFFDQCMDDVAAIHNKPRAMATHRLQLRAVYRWLPTILLRFL